MATLDEVKAAAQAVVDALATLDTTPAVEVPKEVDIINTDGSEEKEMVTPEPTA